MILCSRSRRPWYALSNPRAFPLSAPLSHRGSLHRRYPELRGAEFEEGSRLCTVEQMVRLLAVFCLSWRTFLR